MNEEQIKEQLSDLEDTIIYNQEQLLSVSNYPAFQAHINKRKELLGQLHALVSGALQKPGSLKPQKWYLKRITKLLLQYPLLMSIVDDMKKAKAMGEFDPKEAIKRIFK